MRPAAVSCLATLLLVIATHADGAETMPAPESWAESTLSVREGLVLWLDAGRLNAARAAAGEQPVADGDKVGVWYDASGHRRHVRQQDSEAQPVFQDGALRFDGKKTHLELLGLAEAYREVTVVVVAAPIADPGGFSALMAMNQHGHNDYTSGLNLDLGPFRSRQFTVLNAEGAGFWGAVNLLKSPSEFGRVRRLVLTSSPGEQGTKLYADGRFSAARKRGESQVRMEEVTIGARRYNNGGGAPSARGFFEGDLLEVLVYDRVLSDTELAAMEAYLVNRYGKDKTVAMPKRPRIGKPLVQVVDPPPVQMFVPGFAVRDLGVDLPNINNVKYRADGKLVAVAYNGDIYLISHELRGGTLHSQVQTYWEGKGRLRSPIGMALTPPGYQHGNGVFVASKGKVSLVVDDDGDDRADREIIVADGWDEYPHNVDALGVALDGEGNVYFGLGTGDFTNPYRIDKQGRAHYDLSGERGTILKVSPDFTRREVFATGVRFPVALAFNRHGDLFATDQEGATWLPNGNPFDELLHIQWGRHYGFPPRHPKHLPRVVDEPSVFDYGPQHQSTCGLNFNEPVAGGDTVFGPEAWRGDALVTGYSRGKLYRTRLHKTAAGYVAQNHVLACLNMMPSDACVSPRGSLIVAVHSGLPDWGSGPSGKGRLYEISYADRIEPQPVFAWASGPQEVRVAFDRPLDLTRLERLKQETTIEYGEYVGPGDRFESLRPGYDVVYRQLDAPRWELPVLAAQVTSDRRTLVLNTAPQPTVATYALTLPSVSAANQEPSKGELPQHPTIDLAYDLCGVGASWQPAEGEGGWTGWLPHIDLSVARSFTSGSAEHEKFWSLIQRKGELTLKTKLDLWDMLRPAVQPGSTIDYTWPEEQVTLTVRSLQPLRIRTPQGEQHSEILASGVCRCEFTVTPQKGQSIPLEVVVATGEKLELTINWRTHADFLPRPRPLPLRRLLLPWANVAEPDAAPAAAVQREIPQLEGGDWLRGRELFHGEVARCGVCHKVHGRGGSIGADLSNLIHRDYASVLRDIRLPSAAINPDYISYSIALVDGRILQGTLSGSGDKLLVSDSTGKQVPIERGDIDMLIPSATSIMPEGLDKALGPERLRDLLTFLLTEPLQPAPLEIEGEPPARRRAEVEAALRGSKTIENPRKLHVVLAAGPKDHGPGEHDYPLWQRRWSTLLPIAEGVTVSTAEGWPSLKQFEEADVIVFYSNNPGWSAVRAAELDRFFARGRGVVYIHYAVDGHQAVEPLKDRIGLAWRGGASRFRHGELDVDFSRSQHPIVRGIPKLRLVDESYWRLVGDPADVEVLGTAVEEGAPQPLFWTRKQGAGRVFVSIPGHYNWTFDDPLFRLILLRGIAWAAGEEVDRFNELVTLGARVAP